MVCRAFVSVLSLHLLTGLSATLAFAACSQADDAPPFVCTVSAPTECPSPAPRYADVAPIFASRCASCHTGAVGAPWSLSDYEHVADWQDLIRAEVLHCSMPPRDSGMTMSDEERQAILAWVRCGALE